MQEWVVPDFPLAKFLITIIFCFLASLAHYFIGSIFIRRGFFTRTIAGLSLSAAMTSVVISFCAALATPLIYALLSASFLYWLFHDKQTISAVNNTTIIRLAICICGSLTLFVFLTGCYIKSLITFPDIFNGHQNYFSGISLELLQADYYSRLRILDNYPIEWGKYHFFNGAMTALPQVFLENRNLITFMVAKICILTFFIAAIIEQSFDWKKIKHMVVLTAICILYLLTMLPHQTWWSIFTNAYSSIGLLLLAMLLLNKSSDDIALFFLLCFGLSTSRSLIPAFSLIGLTVFFHIRNNSSSGAKMPIQLLPLAKAFFSAFDNNKTLAACIVVFIAILVMVLSGDASHSPFNPGWGNFYNEGWLNLMSPAITHYDSDMRNHSTSVLQPSTLWYSLWLFIMSYVLIRDNFKKLHHSKLHQFITTFTRPSYAFFLYFSILLLIVTLAANQPDNIQLLLLYYLVPITAGIAFSSKKLKVYVLVFAIISILQIYFFDSAIAIPNFALIEWIALSGFLSCISILSRNEMLSFATITILAIFCNRLPIEPLDIFNVNRLDPTTKHISHRLLNVFQYSGPKGNPVCFNGSDADAAFAAAAGYRVTYSAKKSDNLSISMRFGIPTQADLNLINALCHKQ